MLNNVALVGRLTADPELRTTPQGTNVCSFCLAVNRDYVKKGAERQTDFIDVVAWDKTAEAICKYLKKGSQMSLVGSIQTRNYEDRDGKKRKTTEVVATTVSFLDKKETKDEPVIASDDEDMPF